MSSSPYPILDNRPIDKWKVTELKEELKRRKLITRGLKEELVRRLDEALRVEQQQQEAEAAAKEKANQKDETLGDVTPDPNQTTPIAPVEAALTTQTTLPVIDRNETTTPVAPVEAETTLVVETAPLVGFVMVASDKDEKAGDSSVVDVKPHESEVQPAEAVVVEQVTGLEVTKNDFISITNEKLEQQLKDNEIANDDNNNSVKLEQENVIKSFQEPSAIIVAQESHPMDVEKTPLEHKNNNVVVDGGDSEKLNLDKSSIDESMEDEPGTKQTVNEESQPLVASEKRKLPVNDEEAVVNNEPIKRQRRWNSESIKVPEAQATNNAATPTTTPRLTGLKPDFSRSVSSVSEGEPKERVVPPSPKEPTDSLRIDRFLRPFTLKAVQELLGKTGNVTSFWMDQIKTHCYVSYGSVEEAAATREAVYNLQWPPNGGRLLVAEFVGSEDVKAKLEPPPQASTALPPPPPPLAKAPPVIERLPLPPPPPSVVHEEQEAPIVTLDDLFKKTNAIPRIYYLPLSEEQVAAKLAASNNK